MHPGEPVFGGQHYVYIMDHRDLTLIQGVDTIKLVFPAYDAGAELFTQLNQNKLPNIYQTRVWASAMYVGIPLSVPGKSGWVPR